MTAVLESALLPLYPPAPATFVEGDGVWLTGLPNELDVITVGQEYVREGELVRTVREVAASS